MKKLLKLLSSTALFVVSIILFSCDDSGSDITLKAPGNVNVALTGSKNNMVEITWDVQSSDSYTHSIAYRIERAIEEDGEYEIIGTDNDGSYTDKDVEYSLTYYYRVQAYSVDLITFEEADAGAYSEVVSITVGSASLNPDLMVYQKATGEGSSAVLNGVQLVWDVATAEDLDEFKVYRNGALLTTENAQSYIEEYRYLDENVSFNQTYTYQVVAFDYEGNSYESEEVEFTPTRPDEIERTAPSFVGYDVDFDEKLIYITITDESSSVYDLIDYVIERGDKGSWEDEVKVNELSKDADGNLIITLSTENAPESSGITDLVCKVRIYTNGGYSDWNTHTYKLAVY